jgi:hypothetical protein
MRKRRELIYRVLVAHRPVALGTNGTKVVELGRATFAFGQIVAHLKIENRYDIFTPSNVTFMTKLLSYP